MERSNPVSSPNTSGLHNPCCRALFSLAPSRPPCCRSNPDGLEDGDKEDEGASSEARQELGVVQYESNVMGSRGPRRMQVGGGVGIMGGKHPLPPVRCFTVKEHGAVLCFVGPSHLCNFFL